MTKKRPGSNYGAMWLHENHIVNPKRFPPRPPSNLQPELRRTVLLARAAPLVAMLHEGLSLEVAATRQSLTTSEAYEAIELYQTHVQQLVTDASTDDELASRLYSLANQLTAIFQSPALDTKWRLSAARELRGTLSALVKLRDGQTAQPTNQTNITINQQQNNTVIQGASPEERRLAVQKMLAEAGVTDVTFSDNPAPEALEGP